MEKPGPIRPCVDSKSANTGPRLSLTSSIDSGTCFFFLVFLVPQSGKTHKNLHKLSENLGPIRTCADSKFTSTGSRSNLTRSIYSIHQLFTLLPFFPPKTAKNHQKPLQITENLKPIRHMCRFQVMPALVPGQA